MVYANYKLGLSQEELEYYAKKLWDSCRVIGESEVRHLKGVKDESVLIAAVFDKLAKHLYYLREEKAVKPSTPKVEMNSAMAETLFGSSADADTPKVEVIESQGDGEDHSYDVLEHQIDRWTFGHVRNQVIPAEVQDHE